MNHFEDSPNATSGIVVVVSFIAAMLLDFMPFPFDVFFWLPDLLALTLLFWVIQRAPWVGMGAAFLTGLLADVGTASSLGLHALSYTVMVYFVLHYRRQIVLYEYFMQILVVLAALMCNQAVLVVARLFLNHQIITWQSFIAPLVGALIWPLLSQLILTAVRFRRSSQ